MSNEALWAGEFGTEYTKRNYGLYENRLEWWKEFCSNYSFNTVLEVGCNTGANVGMIAAQTGDLKSVWGCDVNEVALHRARQDFPYINFVYASGLNLPFRDGAFDLVFTVGVLIHQTPDTVERMMQEIIRVSNKYVMAMEYESDIFEEITYRGKAGSLFKGPWGDVYEKRYGLKLLAKGHLGKEDGFDNVTYWILAVR